MARPRRSTFSVVVPDGSGMPAARNEAALPRWKSATKSDLRAGQNTARSGKSTSFSPATEQSTKQFSLLFRLGRRGRVVFELHASNAVGQLLARELLAE